MLAGTRLKLLDRRSGQRFKGCTPLEEGVFRPCYIRNIEEAPKALNVHPTPEKSLPELRVVSLILEDQSYTQRKILRSPRRMPLYCSHFKNIQKSHHRNLDIFDDDFLVRGFEMTTDSAKKRNYPDDLVDANEPEAVLEAGNDDGDELKCYQSGIQIQLTDCCQCVCDLFDNGFRTELGYQEYGFVPMENLNSSRAARPRERVEVKTTPRNNILDPDILKVIRVTMNTKN